MMMNRAALQLLVTTAVAGFGSVQIADRKSIALDLLDRGLDALHGLLLSWAVNDSAAASTWCINLKTKDAKARGVPVDQAVSACLAASIPPSSFFRT